MAIDVAALELASANFRTAVRASDDTLVMGVAKLANEVEGVLMGTANRERSADITDEVKTYLAAASAALS